MPTDIGARRVRELLNRGAQLVEVLPRKEYAEEHLPGAISFPLTEMTPESVTNLEKNEPIIVYCWDNECDLSPRAARWLEALGFKEVYDYVAGKEDWLANGYETVRGDSAEPRAGSLARADVPTCTLDARADEVARELHSRGEEQCVVLDRDDVVMGRLKLADVDPGDGRAIEEIMEPGPSTFRPHVMLSEMADYMDRRKMNSALITTNGGVFIGVLHREDMEREAGRRRDESLDAVG